MIGNGRFGILDERLHAAVLCAADANAFLDARELMSAGVGSGFRIRDIDRVVFCDRDAAGPAELVPLIEELSVLVENLDAVVFAIADEKPAARIHRDRMRFADLTGA